MSQDVGRIFAHQIRGRTIPSVAAAEPVVATGPGPLVVALGTSATNLEPLAQFLSQLPAEPAFALVVVPAPAASNGSGPAEILRKLTRMPLRGAVDGLDIRPGTLYWVPSDTVATISDGVFRVAPCPAAGGPPPIDALFRSLAHECGSRALGAILSGAPSDGALGLKAIKAAGGITLAQDSWTPLDGLPGSPLSALCIDARLNPGELASKLVSLAAHPCLAPPRAGSPLLSEHDLADIQRSLLRATSVDVSHYQPQLVEARVLRRMALGEIRSAGDYARCLRENPGEAQDLIAALVLGPEGFFHEPAAFEALAAGLRGTLWKDRRAGEGFRAWVPFCATGEEVFTTAIVLTEALEQSGAGTALQVFGTALSGRALHLARAATYPPSIAAGIPPDRLSRFFVHESGRYCVRGEIRDACLFAHHDIAVDPPFSRMDLVVCRNRLGSLIPPTQTRVLWLLHYSLRPGGVLALGRSENLPAAPDLFTALPGTPGIFVRNDSMVRSWFGPSPKNQPAAPLAGELGPAGTARAPAFRAAATAVPAQPAPAQAPRGNRYDAAHVQALLEEQALTIEALHVANEEICCSNEELQVTNEELMAAREELQAANQELATINQEMQHRNLQLASASAEFAALLRSVHLPIVTVDNNLRIRRFTPQAQRLFSLAPADIGRPIIDLEPKLDLPDLEPLLRETVDHLAIHELQCGTPENPYRLSIRPYRTEDDRIDGAIIMASTLRP